MRYFLFPLLLTFLFYSCAPKKETGSTYTYGRKVENLEIDFDSLKHDYLLEVNGLSFFHHEKTRFFTQLPKVIKSVGEYSRTDDLANEEVTFSFTLTPYIGDHTEALKELRSRYGEKVEVRDQMETYYNYRIADPSSKLIMNNIIKSVEFDFEDSQFVSKGKGFPAFRMHLTVNSKNVTTFLNQLNQKELVLPRIEYKFGFLHRAIQTWDITEERLIEELKRELNSIEGITSDVKKIMGSKILEIMERLSLLEVEHEKPSTGPILKKAYTEFLINKYYQIEKLNSKDPRDLEIYTLKGKLIKPYIRAKLNYQPIRRREVSVVGGDFPITTTLKIEL